MSKIALVSKDEKTKIEVKRSIFSSNDDIYELDLPELEQLSGFDIVLFDIDSYDEGLRVLKEVSDKLKKVMFLGLCKNNILKKDVENNLTFLSLPITRSAYFESKKALFEKGEKNAIANKEIKVKYLKNGNSIVKIMSDISTRFKRMSQVLQNSKKKPEKEFDFLSRIGLNEEKQGQPEVIDTRMRIVDVLEKDVLFKYRMKKFTEMHLSEEKITTLMEDLISKNVDTISEPVKEKQNSKEFQKKLKSGYFDRFKKLLNLKEKTKKNSETAQQSEKEPTVKWASEEEKDKYKKLLETTPTAEKKQTPQPAKPKSAAEKKQTPQPAKPKPAAEKKEKSQPAKTKPAAEKKEKSQPAKPKPTAEKKEKSQPAKTKPAKEENFEKGSIFDKLRTAYENQPKEKDKKDTFRPPK